MVHEVCLGGYVHELLVIKGAGGVVEPHAEAHEARRLVFPHSVRQVGHLVGSLHDTARFEARRTVALLDKVPRRIVDVDVAYRGFEVGDEYLLGYGLDYEGWYRNLNSVWAVLDMAHFTENPRSFAPIAYGTTSVGIAGR